jgi:fructose-1,6-bisphosphatase/sedoheptulose 1,7-bisphosphatase-like protein
VLEYTSASAQDKWNAALEARTVGGSMDDHLAEKAFANVLLNKEGSGEEAERPDQKGIDPNAYLEGKWYKFMNAKGDCWVYVHNYTMDIQASQPENFTELTEEEKNRLKKLGIFIQDLPEELISIYDKQQCIPIVYGSQDTCEALKHNCV